MIRHFFERIRLHFVSGDNLRNIHNCLDLFIPLAGNRLSDEGIFHLPVFLIIKSDYEYTALSCAAPWIERVRLRSVWSGTLTMPLRQG